jgi:hypothetical protein
MSLKSSYETKEALALDIIKQYNLPKGVTFKGFDKYNRVVFDFSINLESADVSVLSEIAGKANFIDRYCQQSIHLVKG